MKRKKGRQPGVKLPYEKQKFYVFYDENDNVRYCGTAQQLVDEGYYTSITSFRSSVTHIKRGNSGTVVILKGVRTNGRKKNVRKNNNRQ